MTDYIAMKKIWQDCHLAQLKVTCSSEVITASSKIYVADYLIDDLIFQIKEFISGKTEEGFWDFVWR